MLGDCPTIHVGGAYELFRMVIQQIRLGGLSNILPKLGSVCFQEQIAFVLKTVMFTRIQLRHMCRSR